MGRDGGGKRKAYGGRGGGGKKQKYIGRGPGSGQALPSNSRGILVTCDSPFERKAGDESIHIIEEHYAKLAPETEAAPEAVESGSKDFNALIAAEMAALKDKKSHKFIFHDTGVKGTIFIKFPEEPAYPGPIEVVSSICEEARSTRQCRGRHVQRFLPVERTCFASLAEIQRVARALLPPHFGPLNVEGVKDYSKTTAAAATAAGATADAGADAEDADKEKAEKEEENNAAEDKEEAGEKEVAEDKKEEGEEKKSSDLLPSDEKKEEENDKAPSSSAPQGDSAAANDDSSAQAPVPTSPVAFAVEYEHRASDTFDRLQLINVFTDLIPVPPHRVQLTKPDKTVLVQVTRNACAVAVVGPYKELHKFNIRKLAEQKDEEEEGEKEAKGKKEEEKEVKA